MRYFQLFIRKKTLENCLEAGIFSAPQDDEEFPGLSPALKVNKTFSGSITAAKQYNQVHGMFLFILRFFFFLSFFAVYLITIFAVGLVVILFILIKTRLSGKPKRR